MEEERIIQGASVCEEGFDEEKSSQNENEIENKDNSSNEVSSEEDNTLSGIKFEYCISEPITQITQEKFNQIYENHLSWLEALLNPNKKVFRGRANLSGADLSGFNLDGLNLSGGSFVGTCFSNCSLVGTNFTGADLSGADFSNAIFSNTKFKRAILNKAIFTNENKEGIDITLASIIGTVWDKKEISSTVDEDKENDINDKDKDLIDINTNKNIDESENIN